MTATPGHVAAPPLTEAQRGGHPHRDDGGNRAKKQARDGEQHRAGIEHDPRLELPGSQHDDHADQTQR